MPPTSGTTPMPGTWPQGPKFLKVLARDPARYSLYDLYQGIGCAIEELEPVESEDPASITTVLDALSKAERDTLSRPAADVLEGLTGERGGVRELPDLPEAAK